MEFDMTGMLNCILKFYGLKNGKGTDFWGYVSRRWKPFFTKSCHTKSALVWWCSFIPSYASHLL